MKLLACFSGLVLLVGLPVAMSGTAAAADAPKCGLDNGKNATGAPIVLGAVVGKTGPADFSTSALAAKAYFDCVNANGGINGRPIAYSIADDAWSPETSSQVAAKLVKDEKVLALVGSASFVDCAINAAMYEAEGIIVIAGVGIPKECFHSKNIAAINNGPRLSNDGSGAYAVKTQGVKSIVCITFNFPNLSKWNCDGMAQNGVTVHNILNDPSSLDPTSVLLQAMAMKPDMIEVSFSKELAVAMFKAAEQQDLGPKFKWGGPTSLYDPDFPKAIGPYWNGRVYVELELEPIDKKSPDMQNWHAVMNKYAAPSLPRDTFAEAGYLSARIATEALLKLDPNKIDRQAVSKAIIAVKDFKSDIMCGPWYFGPGNEHNPNHAGSIAVVQDGGFKSVSGCFDIDDPELADIRKMEKM